jgi:hypothetical protein
LVDECAIARGQVNESELGTAGIADYQLHVPAADKLLAVFIEADIARGATAKQKFAARRNGKLFDGGSLASGCVPDYDALTHGIVQ